MPRYINLELRRPKACVVNLSAHNSNQHALVAGILITTTLSCFRCNRSELKRAPSILHCCQVALKMERLSVIKEIIVYESYNTVYYYCCHFHHYYRDDSVHEEKEKRDQFDEEREQGEKGAEEEETKRNDKEEVKEEAS